MRGLSSEEIAALERDLGCVLPADVRAKYSDSDGMRAPTNCRLLYPYQSAGDDNVVRINRLLKAQPAFPKLVGRVTILGDDGCGNLLCLDRQTRRAVLWNPADGDSIQAEFPTMTDLWAAVVKVY